MRVFALIAAFAMQASVLSASQVSDAVSLAPAIRTAFYATVLDYPSARFRDVHLTVNLEGEEPRKAYFCGHVNSKNPFGAYMGWRPFAASADPEPFIMIDDGEVETATFIVAAGCSLDNLHPRDPVDRSALLTHR